VVAVLTRAPARAGRGRRLQPTPVAELAAEHGLPVLTPRRQSEPEFLSALADLAPDCAPIVAYGGLIPPAALVTPPLGWVNLHFSLLPAWRGAAPVQHALIAGDDITGASAFRLEEGLDTGPVYGVVTEQIQPRDTAGSLLGRLAHSGAQLLLATLDGLAAGRLAARPQATDGVSHAPKLGPEDSRVRWSAPAVTVDRRVRGCTPAPGAWTTADGQRLRLGPVLPLDSGFGLRPGELRAGREHVLVGTGTHAVQLAEVQPAGRRAMPAAAWLRGLPMPPAELS